MEEGRPVYKSTQEHLLSMWDNRIVKKAMSSIPFYHFDKLKRYFPSIKSIDDFISKPNYLGDIKISVSGLAKDIKEITPQNKLAICKSILSDISNEIHTKFGDYRGTKLFYREPIRKHFKDKKLYFSLNKGVDAETGKPTMRHNIDEKYYVDLKQKDWYVFNENYGSSEEKFLVKFIDSQIEDLNKKYSEIYLLRNERFFKLFRFSDGKATEPDFVLFLTEKDADDSIIYQLFIEPKGQQLLDTDKWKEDFLQEIETEATVDLFQNEQFRLIGMPFFNNETTKKEVFKNKLQNI